jgi:hypothetical protein
MRQKKLVKKLSLFEQKKRASRGKAVQRLPRARKKEVLAYQARRYAPAAAIGSRRASARATSAALTAGGWILPI